MKKLYKLFLISTLSMVLSTYYTVAQQVIGVIQGDDVKLLDPTNGQIIDPSFIDLSAQNPGTPKAVIQVGDEIWISQQIGDRIDRYDLDGQFIDDIGGQVANGGLDNIKGMAVINNTEVWVTNAGTQNDAPGNAIVRIDFDGNILGNFSTGSDSSFDIVDNGSGEAYISYIGTGTRIERRDYTGAILGDIVGTGVVNFIQQIDISSSGNVLASVFSNNTGSGNNSGVYNFSLSNGNILDYWADSQMRGVMELGNGDIIYSNSSGISIIDVSTGNTSSLSGGSGQYFGRLNLDCDNPPTGDENQELCEGETVDDLDATGTNIQWYATPTGGSPLSPSDVLVDGNTYYASQTSSSGCESDTRLEVNVSLNNTVAPTGDEVQNFCNDETIDDLVVTGNDVTWYDEASGGNVLSGTDILVDGESYFASQTVAGCESQDRLEVEVIIGATPITGDANQIITVIDPNDATLDDLVVSPSNVTWYATEADALSETNPLPGSTVLTNGESYYAVYTEDGCSSEPFQVNVAVDVVANLESLNNDELKCYPNPTSGAFNISYTKPITEYSVISVFGQTLANERINSNEFQIDLSSFSEGSYFVKIVSGDSTKTIKVVKKN